MFLSRGHSFDIDHQKVLLVEKQNAKIAFFERSSTNRKPA